jgi:hypothetical protein
MRTIDPGGRLGEPSRELQLSIMEGAHDARLEIEEVRSP